jgi:hypothetical protein
MLIAMLVNMATLMVVYVALMAARLDVAKREGDGSPERVVAGEAVRPPRLNEVEDV